MNFKTCPLLSNVSCPLGCWGIRLLGQKVTDWAMLQISALRFKLLVFLEEQGTRSGRSPSFYCRLLSSIRHLLSSHLRLSRQSPALHPPAPIFSSTQTRSSETQSHSEGEEAGWLPPANLALHDFCLLSRSLSETGQELTVACPAKRSILGLTSLG